MSRYLRTTVIAFSAFTLWGCAAPLVTVVNDPQSQLRDHAKTALCLPVDTLHVDYVDNTKAIADTIFNDSFFTTAANALIAYECSKHFRVHQWTPADSDSLALFRRGAFSPLARDAASLGTIAPLVVTLARRYKTDLVVVPYAYTIKNIAVRPSGWRNDKYASGPGYERPVSYKAISSFHVQIWDKNGTLLYERIGKDDTGRPFMYSLFKKEKKPDKDIVKYAKRFYAPPLIKSLYGSIKSAMLIAM